MEKRFSEINCKDMFEERGEHYQWHCEELFCYLFKNGVRHLTLDRVQSGEDGVSTKKRDLFISSSIFYLF